MAGESAGREAATRRIHRAAGARPNGSHGDATGDSENADGDPIRQSHRGANARKVARDGSLAGAARSSNRRRREAGDRRPRSAVSRQERIRESRAISDSSRPECTERRCQDDRTLEGCTDTRRASGLRHALAKHQGGMERRAPQNIPVVVERRSLDRTSRPRREMV